MATINILVHIAKIPGNKNGELFAKTMGKNIAKYNTPLYGQNAKANIIHSKNDHKYPFVSFEFLKFCQTDILIGILINPNIKNAIMISNGHKILSQYHCNMFCILKLSNQ